MDVSLGRHCCVAGSITLSRPFWVMKQPLITPRESGMLAKTTVPARTSSPPVITEADASRECLMRITIFDNVLFTHFPPDSFVLCVGLPDLAQHQLSPSCPTVFPP